MNHALIADQTLRELALAVARNAVGANEPIATVLAAEAILPSEYARIETNPTFQRYVGAYTKDLTENGFSFAAKSQVLAEDLLPIAHALVKDPDVAGPARVKMLENLVEWAGLKPKAAAVQTAGAGYSITINIPSAGIELQSNQNAMAVKKLQDVIEVPVINIPNAPREAAQAPDIPPTTEKRASNITFDEPDTYEYAGEDAIS